eukprot:SAG31_NODE_12018_length_975_cov_8.334094_2_plen_161_part_00
MCKEAREVLLWCVLFLDLIIMFGTMGCLERCTAPMTIVRMYAQSKLPNQTPKQLFALRAKASEGMDVDEWAGKVQAVVKAVQASAKEQKEEFAHMTTKQASYMDGKLADMATKQARYMDGKLAEMDGKLAEMDGKLADMTTKQANMDAKLDKILAALPRD